MKFIDVDLFTLTTAIMNAGWTKNVSRNDDGSLNWWGETDYPTDDEIQVELDKLQAKE